MALRRMFSLNVIDTDRFLEMPSSARLLYYDLGMRADDDGFASAPKKIMRITGASDDDLKLLITKGYIIPFESGVCVITDWKQNNYIRPDRYTETTFKTEKASLSFDENGSYVACLPSGIPSVNQNRTSGIPRLGKGRVRIVEEILSKGTSVPQKEKSRFIPPAAEEVAAYCTERNNGIDAEMFVAHYASKGWKVGKDPMVDWKAAVHTWERRRKEESVQAGTDWGEYVT